MVNQQNESRASCYWYMDDGSINILKSSNKNKFNANKDKYIQIILIIKHIYYLLKNLKLGELIQKYVNLKINIII